MVRLLAPLPVSLDLVRATGSRSAGDEFFFQTICSSRSIFPVSSLRFARSIGAGGKTIEQLYCDVPAHTPEVCKGPHLYNGYLTIKDDRDSWGMCTTSTECKIVITVVLTVTSGMDPHMISGTQVGLIELGLVSLVG
jgi:hypothetical protein